jgi:hypothetical protein
MRDGAKRDAARGDTARGARDGARGESRRRESGGETAREAWAHTYIHTILNAKRGIG